MMEEQHRRGFLCQVAALPLIGGALVAPAGPAQAADAALLEQAARLDEAEDGLHQARARACVAAGAFIAACPPWPPSLVVPDAGGAWRFDDDVMFQAHLAISQPSQALYWLRREIDEHSRRTPYGRSARKLYRVAKAHALGVEEARSRTEYASAEAALYDARAKVAAIALDVFALPASTLVGIVVKARTIVAYDASLEPASRGFRHTDDFSIQLARELVALLPNAGAGQ